MRFTDTIWHRQRILYVEWINMRYGGDGFHRKFWLYRSLYGG